MAKSFLRMHHEGRLGNEIHPLRGGLLIIAVRVDRPDLLALLLDLGLDPDEPVAGEHGTRVSWGMPLWFAAPCGRHDIAELLLARGADVNAIVFASGDALHRRPDRRRGDEDAAACARGSRYGRECPGPRDRCGDP